MRQLIHGRRLALAVVSASVLLVSLAGSASGATGPAPAAETPPPAAEEQVVLAERLERELGDRAAGSFIDSAGELRVNVVDDSAEQQVRAAGAEPQRVAFSQADLEAAMAVLDAAGAPAGLSWGIDAPSNSIVVSVPQGADYEAASQGFVDLARSTGVPVTVERVDSAPRPLAYFGGEALVRSDGARCSAGFIARRNSDGAQFVVTAGHCTQGPGSWSGDGKSISGTDRTSYPGNDYGIVFIAKPSVLDPRGSVLYNGQGWDISGSNYPPVNTGARKTGSTTGTTSGRLLRYGVSVSYGPGEQVNGLIETNICAGPGDSGGPLFSGHKAIGMVSGGGGGACGSGFRSYYQPVREALNAYGLTLR